MKPVELFHVGPQKCGTTWVYACLRQHPGVACPDRDAVHYFDMFYHRGRAWYERQFPPPDARRRFDPTPSYIRSPLAPARIARENARARIVVCLRDPVERAFSHYWHEKKKGKIRFAFREVLENYDLFASWIEPGFYAEHIARYLEHFDRDQILCQRFERLASDPEGFLAELLSFADLDTDVRPDVLGRRVNAAGPHAGLASRGMRGLRRALAGAGLRPPRWLDAGALGEYRRGVPPGMRAALLEVCEPEIARLEALLGVDLADWRMPRDA